MRTLENTLIIVPEFDKLAGVWCKVCGAGNSVTMITTGNYTRSFRVMGENGPFLNEREDTEDSNEDYRCEECDAYSTYLEDIVTENVWIAEEAYNKHYGILKEKAREETVATLEEEEEDEGA